MKTILDIKKTTHVPVRETIYNVESLSDLFAAIEDALKTNPLVEKIKVRHSESIDVQKWMYKYGFDLYDYASYGEIKFKGFSKWVYFNNDIPVFFDDSCSGIDVPPHTTTFKSNEYDILEFDSYKKIQF